jgi:hypothetical protein
MSLPVWAADGPLPAFPGALGYGAEASGGRNGTVYHVTTLADGGPGSFREAVSTGGRTVVFDVGGYVTLQSKMGVKGNTTIAGQTAPGGIGFRGAEISFGSQSNIICRFIRIRPGGATRSIHENGLGLFTATNCIVDHVSLEFSPWNNVDAVRCDRISIQHCLDANPIYQKFGAHIENPGASFSWTYNIFANTHNRNPLAKINDTFINNVLYNYQSGYTTHTGTPFKHDIVNNYFIMGPGSGGRDNTWFQIDRNQSIYDSGNLKDTNRDGALNGVPTRPAWYQGPGTVLNAPWSPWTTNIPTLPPGLAYCYDVSSAGAFPRDEVDSLVISQIKTLGKGIPGTTNHTAGPDSGLYTNQIQTGLANDGYGVIPGLAAAADSDGDGMPDYWEAATGTATNAANALTNTADGYTPLEHYLNWLAEPHAATQINAAVDVDLTQFTGGFSYPAFKVATPTNGTVTLVNGTQARFVPAKDFKGVGGFVFTVTDGAGSLSVPVSVCMTPLTPPASAVQFHGALCGVNRLLRF